MRNLIEFLKSKYFWLSVLGSAVMGILIVGAVSKWLDSYTRHGETITVPDLHGRKISELESFLKYKNLKYKIADSSVFELNIPPGSVIEQDPKPNEKVKEGRTIYVTITKTAAPEIQMPNLIDVSYRQAEAILNSFGLKVGELIYKPDLCKSCVLGTQVRGYDLHPGDRLAKGTVVNLILGDGFGNTLVTIPQLYNLSLDEALFVIKGSGLLAGNIEYDETVRDSSLAKIYRQSPEPADTATVGQGQVIDLFLTQSNVKIQQNNPYKN